MISSSPGKQASLHLWKPRALAGVTLFRADHIRQRFCRHTHDEYALGVITQGVLGFDYRRAWHRAGSGEINLVVPGEAHTGEPDLGESWSYRMLYIHPEVLQEIARECGRRNETLPFFNAGVIQDRALARLILRLHEDLRDESMLALEAQGRMLHLLSAWLRRHAEKKGASLRELRHEPNVERTRSYLEECWESKPSLRELAAREQLSSYQLLRAFMRQYGLPPHAYLIQRQLREARRMLDRGMPIVDAASAAGFADQSHLHRHFKRTWGITPGQYCNFVQESARGRG
jgi:AraC-like DNA-binding protein